MLTIHYDKANKRCFFDLFKSDNGGSADFQRQEGVRYHRWSGALRGLFRKTYKFQDQNGKHVCLNKNSTINWVRNHSPLVKNQDNLSFIQEALKRPSQKNIEASIELICKAKQEANLNPIYAQRRQVEAQHYEQFLKQLWDNYSPHKLFNLTEGLLKVNDEGSIYSSGTDPDAGLANLPEKFKDDPDVFFAPLDTLSPSKPDDLQMLQEILKASFATGKKMVVIRFGEGDHSVVGAFEASGQFKVIDGMGSKIIDIDRLAKALNQSSILRLNGTRIEFNGEYINTHLQKGGVTCLKIATLYGYQIAKRKDLNAYQEVNGAFVEGRLHTFEDYQKITGAKFVKQVGKASTCYDEYMSSWAYRSLGWLENSWHDISLSAIPSKTNLYGVYLTCIKLTSNQPSCLIKDTCFPLLKTLDFEYGVEREGLFIPIRDLASIDLEEVPTSGSTKLKNLFPKEWGKECFIFTEQGNPQAKVVRLKQGEKLVKRLWEDGKPSHSFRGLFL